MLQERINELNSAIVNVVGDLVYILGFYNTEMLNLYLNEGKDNWSSKGRYPNEELVFHNIKTNATIILQENGLEVARFQYVNVTSGVLEYFNESNKSGKATAVYEIRNEQYSSMWNLRLINESHVFNEWEEMRSYLLATYNYDIGEVLLDGEKVTSRY